MSEEDTVRLLDRYRDLQKENEAMRKLLKEYADVVADYLEHTFLHVGFDELEQLQECARKLGIEGEAS